MVSPDAWRSPIADAALPSTGRPPTLHQGQSANAGTVTPSKGNSGIDISGDVGCTYKTGYVLQHKFREGMLHSMRDIRLHGEVEMDGGWFGGYIKPENQKINRVDRRLSPSAST